MYGTFEYQCTQGHAVRSHLQLESQDKINELCAYCNPRGSQLHKQPGWRIMKKRVPVIGSIEKQIRTLDDELLRLEKPNLDSFVIEKDHETLKRLLGAMLTSEGFEVEYEVTLPGLQFVWRADVVGHKDGEIHTVVEVGKLSNSAKLSVLESIFPRFIWVPYVPILDVEKLLSISEGLGGLPTAIQNVRTQLDEIKATFQSSITDAIAANKEVINRQARELKELEDEYNRRYFEYGKLFASLKEMQEAMDKVRAKFEQRSRF